MTHFEYVAAAHTLILTFAAARILGGVSYVLMGERRYWVHISWTVLAILFCLTSFWVFWDYRAVEWTLVRLILLLAAPALIYVFSAIAIPADAGEVGSWRDYFFEVRERLFISGAVMIVAILLSNQMLAGVSPLHASQLPLYAMLAVFVLGAVFDDERLHAMFAIVPPLNFVGVLVVVSRADSLLG